MIVLDTHIWLWWINQDRVSLKTGWHEAIQGAERIGVSAISCFEVAWLEKHGRIELPCPRGVWFEKALGGSGVELLPVTPHIAGLAVDLAEHHRDPQDRIIIATTLVHAAKLLSADGKFALYEELAGHLVV